MMKKLLLITLLFLTGGSFLSAQTLFDKCVSKHQEERLAEKYPAYAEAVEETFQQAMAHASAAGKTDIVFQIPVVVHIVYNTDAENLPDEMVMSQLEVLNEDYRRMNANAANTRAEFLPVVGDAEIEFVLADIDPDGNFTSGITRTPTDVESFSGGGDFDQILQDLTAALAECGLTLLDVFGGAELTPEEEECANAALEEALGGEDGGLGALDAVKSSTTGGVDPWPTDQYLNIWVCDLSITLFGETVPALLGFAYPPVGAPNWPDGSVPTEVEDIDGVVVHYQVFGKDNPAAIGSPLEGVNDQGRTATHEVGHYLGLRHVWGDGPCEEDDGMSDTPQMASESQSETFTCLLDKNTCDEGATDLPDMIENFMDYSPDDCMNSFTLKQIDLMRAMLEGPRSGLIEGQVSGLEELATNGQINVFPQPAANQVFIEFEQSMGEVEIKLVNLSGQILQTEYRLANGQISMNLSDVANGVYFLNIGEGESLISRKIVVQK